jgi:hypothetical protein
MGAMLLFKYLYSIVVFLVELTDAVAQRRPFLLFRIENLIAGAIVALYLFCWLVLDPGQRTVIGAVVSAIDANLADPRANWLQVATNSVVAFIFVLAFRVFQLPGRLIALGLALAAGAIIVAWIQERWYSHHLFPITMAYIAWWWIARARMKWWAQFLLPLLLIGPIVREYRNTASYQEAVRELDRTMNEAGQSVAGKRVGILTMHPSPYNQYLASHGGVRWNSSMNNGYVAAELKPFDRPENSAAACQDRRSGPANASRRDVAALGRHAARRADPRP